MKGRNLGQGWPGFCFFQALGLRRLYVRNALTAYTKLQLLRFDLCVCVVEEMNSCLLHPRALVVCTDA